MRTLARIGVLIALATSPAAFAVDLFTVNVPMDVKNLNAAITHVSVYCSLWMRNPVTGALGPIGPNKFSSEYAPVGGNYTGPSPLTFVWRTEDFAVADLSNLSYVTGGMCQLGLEAGSDRYAPTGGSSSPVLASKPGTTYRPQVTFTFP